MLVHTGSRSLDLRTRQTNQGALSWLVKTLLGAIVAQSRLSMLRSGEGLEQVMQHQAVLNCCFRSFDMVRNVTGLSFSV